MYVSPSQLLMLGHLRALRDFTVDLLRLGRPDRDCGPPKKKKQKICNEPRAAAPHAHAENYAPPLIKF